MQNNYPLPLFTYGSLMNDFFNFNIYLKNRTSAQPVKARIQGSLFHLAKKGYAALLPGEGWVYGEVFVLNNFSETLPLVDRLEGFNQGERPNEYNREILTVELWNDDTQDYDRPVQAYVYRYAVENDPYFLEESFPLPTGNWRTYHETGKIE